MKAGLAGLGLCVILLGAGCASPSRWEMVRNPDAMDAAAMLAADGLGLTRDERADEVPMVPVRKRLRPCCAFGSGLKVRVGPVKIPGIEIANILAPEEIGRHHYDAGTGATDQVVGSERNGLVYTCRGGFIDTAHVRDYADWTFYLATLFGRHLETGGVFELPALEGGRRRFVLSPVDPELIAIVGRRKLMASLGIWAGFQLSVWHEIATWYGWSSFDLFSERASAFSPEDLYSNLLGAKIAGAILSGGGGSSEALFNRAVDAWFAQSLDFLGAVDADRGERAISSVDGLWWDSSARLPDANLVLRRSIQHGSSIGPWLVSEAGSFVPSNNFGSMGGPQTSRADPRICGEEIEPHVLLNPSRIPLLAFDEILAFQVEPEVGWQSHPDLATSTGRLSSNDFAAIMERIREQAKAEFGANADRFEATNGGHSQNGEPQ